LSSSDGRASWTEGSFDQRSQPAVNRPDEISCLVTGD
jgi:hypothetical protein